MKRTNLLIIFAMLSLCSFAMQSDDDIKVVYSNNTVKVVPSEVSGLEIKVEGAHLKIIERDSLLPENHPTRRFILSGESMDGSFTLKAKDSISVVLDGLNLTSRRGAPLWFKTKGSSTLTVCEGKESVLNLVAVKDTATEKSAVVFANGNLWINGRGRLVVNAFADGCKGINVKKNLTISDLKLDVATFGDNLGPDTLRRMGPPPGFDGKMPEFDPENMPEEMKAFFEKMKEMREKHGQGGPQGMPFGGMPQGGFGGFPGGMPMGGFPEGGFPGGFGGGFGGKQKFLGTCKGIKADETITIESGIITVNTESRGAEGIEGKKGITVNGGEIYVKAMDDAINSSGQIIFNGGKTTAWSVGNDAVDSNEGGEGSILIAGGHVCGYSQVGSPEEAFDSDFTPVVITGGTAFGVGGSMGAMTPRPNEQTLKQPTLIIYNLSVKEGDKVVLFNAKEKKKPLAVISESLPFAMDGSHTLFTSPELKIGEKYILKIGKVEKKFKIEKMFQTIGEEGFGGFGGFGGFPGGFPMGGFGGFPGGGGMPF